MLLRKTFEASPALPRVLPFMVFLGLTFCQGQFGEASRYGFYLAKTVVGAWLIWEMRPFVAEMRWAVSWEAVVVGIGIFAIWIGLDGLYPNAQGIGQRFVDPGLRKIGLGFLGATPGALPWNPFARFGEDTALGWGFAIVRVVGSAVVVPPLEEVFYRSFLYRWIARPDFEAVPPGKFYGRPFLITALIFGFAHNEWLAGILCAAAYQGLVLRKQRLGDAMAAHAITNFLLGAWVVWRGAWHFW